MSRKKILVTGADGFIGSHLTEMLVREGYDVRAFVMYNSFNSWGWLDHVSNDVKGHFEVVAGDIRDPYGIDNAMQNIDIVLHLAALIAIPFSYHSPDAYVQTNVSGTLNVLQAARVKEVSRIITTSTSETYGSAQFVPISEEHPLNAQSPYAATKVGADQIAIAFYRSFELPVSVLRPFNTYGPRQSARAVIPTIISQIASGSRKIKLGALTPTRDFTFVKDTARGFTQAMQCDRAIGEVINIGSGFEISIADTVDAIAEAMGVKVEIVRDDARLRPKTSEVDPEIARVAIEFGAQVPFIRPFHLASDTASEWEAWKHAIEFFKEKEGDFLDPFISIPPTSPLRQSDDIVRCLNKYLKGNADVVIAVSNAHRNPWFNMVKLEAGEAKLVNNNPNEIFRRQDAPKVYDMTTVAYVANPDFIMSNSQIFAGRVEAIIVPVERAIDIDTIHDFELAEYFLMKVIRDETD